MARLVKFEALKPIKIEPQEKAIFVCACGLSKIFLCAMDITRDAQRNNQVAHTYTTLTGRIPKLSAIHPEVALKSTEIFFAKQCEALAEQNLSS